MHHNSVVKTNRPSCPLIDHHRDKDGQYPVPASLIVSPLLFNKKETPVVYVYVLKMSWFCMSLYRMNLQQVAGLWLTNKNALFLRFIIVIL